MFRYQLKWGTLGTLLEEFWATIAVSAFGDYFGYVLEPMISELIAADIKYWIVASLRLWHPLLRVVLVELRGAPIGLPSRRFRKSSHCQQVLAFHIGS